jgi:endonuclease YncB( thermonuclease family)
MKNKHFVFINTSDMPINIGISVIDSKTNQVTLIHSTLNPKEVLNDTTAKLKVVQGNLKHIQVLDVVTSEGKSLLRPSAFGSSDEILKNSAIFDIETSGRLGSDSITQLGVYDVASKKTTMIVPTANALLSEDKVGERGYRLRTNTLDPSAESLDFRKIKYADTLRIMSQRDPAKYLAYSGMNTQQLSASIEADAALKSVVEDYMIQTDKFQAVQVVENQTKLIEAKVGTDATGKELSPDVKHKRVLYSAINSGTVSREMMLEQVRAAGYDPEEFFGKGGTNLELRQGLSIRQILSDDLPSLLNGKVAWIANASFESGQIGAQIDAYAQEAYQELNISRKSNGLPELSEEDFRRGYQYGAYEKEIESLNASRGGKPKLQTKNPFFGTVEGVSVSTGKPFFVTGVEYSRARGLAQKTGDWSGMYDALVKHTRPGDVRDILDLVRTQQSMSIKQGLISNTDKPIGVGVEVQARLYAYTEAIKRGESDAFSYLTGTKELHAAFGDTAISEKLILNNSLEQLEALNQVARNTDIGRRLLDEAAQGRGAYYLAQQYAGAFQVLTQNVSPDNESLSDVLYRQRAGRNLLQLAEEGSFETREYKPGLGVVQQARKAGDIAVSEAVPIVKAETTRHHTLSGFIESMSGLQDYKSADQARILDEIVSEAKPFFNPEGTVIPGKEADLAALGSKYSESASEQIAVFERRFSGASAFKAQFDANIKHQAVLMQNSGTGRIVTPPQAKPPAPPKTITPPVITPPTPTPSPSHFPPPAPLSPGGTPTLPAPPPSPPPSGVKPIMPTSHVPPVSVKPPVKPMNIANAVALPQKPALRNIDEVLRAAPIKGYAGVALGLMAFAAATPEAPQSKSLLAPTYDQFLEAKAQEYGSKESYLSEIQQKYNAPIEGMSESGIAAVLRKRMTDFGSPYQGMGYSSSVLEDHNLRRERQNYINRQFMVRHFSEQGDIGLFFKKHIDSAFRKQYGISIEKPSIIYPGDTIDPSKYGSLRGSNLQEYAIDPSQISVEDADTITVNRGGAINNGLASFMGTTGQAKFRLAGIDAPETSHEYRAAQPYAEAAKKIAQELLANAKEVKVVVEPGESTYGRQVGMVYVDGKNLNLELVKRGAAAYLPYKGKGKPPMYDQQAFEKAEEQAYEARRGMWSEAYFQAYKEITKASGQTVTFNMLNNPAKVVNSSNMMSMYAEMNKAQRQGYVNKEELEILGKKIGSLEKPFADDPKYSAMNLETYGQPNNSILSVLDQQKYEIGNLMRTRGSDRLTEKTSVKKVNQNNVEMAQLVTSDSVYQEELNQKSVQAKTREIESFKRKQKMAAMQQSALRNQFNSPIGHYRM